MYLTRKEVDILEYCLPNCHQMWAATIMGMIIGCDFRDAEVVWKQRRIEYGLQGY